MSQMCQRPHPHYVVQKTHVLLVKPAFCQVSAVGDGLGSVSADTLPQTTDKDPPCELPVGSHPVCPHWARLEVSTQVWFRFLITQNQQ